MHCLHKCLHSTGGTSIPSTASKHCHQSHPAYTALTRACATQSRVLLGLLCRALQVMKCHVITLIRLGTATCMVISNSCMQCSTSTSSSEGQVMPKLGGQSMYSDTSHDCTGTHSAQQYPTTQQNATDSVVATSQDCAQAQLMKPSATANAECCHACSHDQKAGRKMQCQDELDQAAHAS